MRDVFVTHHNIISSLGFDTDTNFQNLKSRKTGIEKVTQEDGSYYCASLVNKEKIDFEFSKIGQKNVYTYLEKMMLLSVKNILINSNIEITDKTGLIVATTKGNIETLSLHSDFHENGKRAYLTNLAETIQKFFNFQNEAIILSNACISGLLALSIADRFIKSEVYDNVIIVSGDMVTEFTLSGFTSFQAVSQEPCKPYSKFRSGVTLGEAVASVLVTANPKKTSSSIFKILGNGSSNDANHISGPSRDGEGLFLSVQSALREAKLRSSDVDYISAHGTATNYNDEMESIAFDRLEMSDIPLNSLKGYYGHTLGASGLLESIIGMESLSQNTLIASHGFDQLGVSKGLNIIEETTNKELNSFLKTASGFGGCNAAIIFYKVN